MYRPNPGVILIPVENVPGNDVIAPLVITVSTDIEMDSFSAIQSQEETPLAELPFPVVSPVVSI